MVSQLTRRSRVLCRLHIFYGHGRHGQPVQDLGHGQRVCLLPQDLDEVAGTKLSKN